MRKMLLAMGIISLLAGTTGALAACKGENKDLTKEEVKPGPQGQATPKV